MSKKGIWEKDLVAWTDGEIAEELTDRYKETEPPPCAICGATMSIQAIGGGRPTVYACSDRDDSGARKEGRLPADDHYSRSRWEDYRRGGDSVVMELLRRYQAEDAEP